jgi:hypothetical protein
MFHAGVVYLAAGNGEYQRKLVGDLLRRVPIQFRLKLKLRLPHDRIVPVLSEINDEIPEARHIVYVAIGMEAVDAPERGDICAQGMS